ncbi:probable pectinesterase 29 [Primulina eburnea]|uniref:probable pectinesterase 29 n=1 Tax=Primulina eburnea TaxID=1245227 RepID=UPI003C6C0B13
MANFFTSDARKMSLFQSFVGLIIMVLCSSPNTNATTEKNHKKFEDFPTIYVDPSGKGNFTRIQAAIDSVPSYNKNWICIYIKAGTYREKIRIPYDRPWIYLKGEGKRATIVTWDDHESIETSSTFTAFADNIVVKALNLCRNSYNQPPGKSGNPITPAVAGNFQGDKYVFVDCAFIGYQDTLWDVQGRHYFKSCIIEGSIDFIFGSGQSIYEGCVILVAAGSLGVPGYITAQGRQRPNDANGFVFKACNIVGDGKTFLGRPWRSYARVVFADSFMSGIVVPEGWDPWYSVGHEDLLTYAEHNCRGPGSDLSRRVKWANTVSVEVVNRLISMSFIDNEGWIKDWMVA